MKNAKGFTLIELLIYMSIVSIMLTALIPFAWNIIEGGAKSATEQEVFSNARTMSERIKYEIRNATAVNSISATQISLATPYSFTNPTIISSTSGNLTIQQGAAPAAALNSSNTNLSNLAFTNFTSADNKTKNIQFIFTLKASSSATTRQEFNESTTIESDAEVRSN